MGGQTIEKGRTRQITGLGNKMDSKERRKSTVVPMFQAESSKETTNRNGAVEKGGWWERHGNIRAGFRETAALLSIKQ